MDEIVIILGYHAAGKTTHVENYTKIGYHRLNRDEIGGKLDTLPLMVADLYKKGIRKFVLDNTYADIESRKSIIKCAKQLCLPIKCIWLDTSFEDAQYNACQRMIRKVGHLMSPEEFKTCKDPNLFPPVALFSYKKKFQKPTVAEGFDAVEKVPFVRKNPSTFVNKALILDYDGTLRTSKGEFDYPIKPEEVEILPRRKEKLNEYVKKGYKLFGVSNQSGIAKGNLTVKDAEACFDKTNELLGHKIKYYYCSHNIPPVVCYCRKPSNGLGVYLIETERLDASQCIFVGDQTTDETFSKRCGFKYVDQEEFFK